MLELAPNLKPDPSFMVFPGITCKLQCSAINELGPISITPPSSTMKVTPLAILVPLPTNTFPFPKN
jgi:hypothetical protein